MSKAVRRELETLYVDTFPEDRYAVVSMHRPENLNAGNPTMFEEIAEVMDGFIDNDEVRAVVLRGDGDRAFSAGADLGGMTFDLMGNCYKFIRQSNLAFEAIERLQKPVVAAVNGYAFGFGLEISLVCDIVLATDKARFGLREMNHGLVPVVTLTRGLDILGRKRVAYMAMTSDDVSGSTLEEWGMVNKVVPAEELESAYTDLAKRLANRAPLAMAVTKRLLNREAGAHYRDAENVMPGVFASQDVAEGRMAFEERRTAVYTGN